MQVLLTELGAAAAYLGASAAMLFSLRQEALSGDRIVDRRLPVFGLATLAAALHGSLLTSGSSLGGPVNLSFLNALSSVSLLLVVIVLLASLARPIDKLGIVVYPLAAAVLLLQLTFPIEPYTPKDYSGPIRIHILVSMLAYSVLNIAAIQAVLLALQDWALRRHRLGRLSRTLPPLQTMESMLFQLIAAGLALLTASLLTGFLFLDDLFAQHVAHKTVLSIAAWLVFATLIWGRQVHGWRGRIAIRWTLSGFAALMLGYFGSKVVLELILHRV